jgi:Flp pilus assembly protein TadD
MTTSREDSDRLSFASNRNPSDEKGLPRPEPAPPVATGAYTPVNQAEGPDPRATEAYRGTPPRSDRYVARKFHARGGMGEVWLAEDVEIGRPVAVKRLRSSSGSDRDRFLSEARITGQLEHPGVIPVHDMGSDDNGQPFYIMTFIQGRTLQTALEEYHAGRKAAQPREVQWLRLLEAFVRLCQTVAYAHHRGVIHRDLKPDNVMLGPYGETLVLDWGLAKKLGQPEIPGGATYVPLASSGGNLSETEGGMVLGAPPYMAPEVAEGNAGAADQRTDVYLLGSTLYEILTGRPPRQGKSKAEMIELARTMTPTPPRRIKPQVPPALEAICQKAMARRKEDRYPGAQDVADDVQRFLAGEPVAAYPEGPLARAGRWTWRHRRALTRGAVAAVVLAGGVFAALRIWEAEEQRARASLAATALEREKETRDEVRRFRTLADEAQFFAASTDAVGERAPYFVPQRGEEVARAAERIASRWGQGLEELALPGEEPALRREVYDLLLLLAQLRSEAISAPRTAAEEGLKLLERAAALEKPSRGYYRVQASCYRLLARLEDALAAERLATAADTPGTAHDSFLLGEELRRHSAPGNLKDAIKEYQQALREDPTHYWARFQLGRCLLAMGQDDRAIDELSVCIQQQPNAPYAYSVRGLSRGLGKQFAEAEKDLQRALAISADFRPARLNLGTVLWLKKDTAGALKEFEAVLQPDDKRLIEATYYRGLLYLERSEPSRAAEDFERLIREQPNFRPAYLALAQAHFAQDREALGLEDLNRYLLVGDSNFDRRSPEAAEQRGRLLRRHVPAWKLSPAKRKAKLELALTELDSALKAGRRTAALFDDRGAILEHLRKTPEAIRAYDQGLTLSSEDVKLLLKRAAAFGNLNPPEYEKAEADFARVVRLAPTNAEAYAGLGYVRACREAPADAQRAATQALLHGGGNHLILHNVACIYARLAETDKERRTACEDTAIDLLRRALELWGRREAGPNERTLIQNEGAFKSGLDKRPEFRQLLRGVE